MQPATVRLRAREVGLFLVLTILINGLIFSGPRSASLFVSTFYLAFFVHVGVTLHDGAFSRWRSVTWLLLLVSWIAAETTAFLGFIFPFGQLQFWLAAKLPAVATTHLAAITPWLWPGLPLALLVADIAVMHRDEWQRPMRQIIGFFAAVATAAIILGLVVAAVLPVPPAADRGLSPMRIAVIPDWYLLPFQALLRVGPTKLGGVVMVFAAMIMPVLWPWAGADEIRFGPGRRVWGFLCLALAAAWIGLGYLGSRPPDPTTMRIAQGLAVLYFAFFLVLPFIFKRFSVRRTVQ